MEGVQGEGNTEAALEGQSAGYRGCLRSKDEGRLGSIWKSIPAVGRVWVTEAWWKSGAWWWDVGVAGLQPQDEWQDGRPGPAARREFAGPNTAKLFSLQGICTACPPLSGMFYSGFGQLSLSKHLHLFPRLLTILTDRL